MRAKFIIEGVDDTSWEKYKNKVKSLGLDTYMKVYNAAYERAKQI